MIPSLDTYKMKDFSSIHCLGLTPWLRAQHSVSSKKGMLLYKQSHIQVHKKMVTFLKLGQVGN